jgi:hypothetical protein
MNWSWLMGFSSGLSLPPAYRYNYIVQVHRFRDFLLSLGSFDFPTLHVFSLSGYILPIHQSLLRPPP